MKNVIIIASIATAILSGCATQRFEMNPGAGTNRLDDAQTFFISGLGQTQTVDAAKICGGAAKVRSVETETTFLNGLLGSLTFGIYTPRQARVTCN